MRVDVRNPPYPIVIGRGVRPERPKGPLALLYDERVAGFARALEADWEIPHALGIPGGEGAKTLEVYGRVLSFLAQRGLPRDATLVVVGGGSLTDLGGFVAATYLRGIPYLSFPTTTLALVDASVGGKTGLNLPEGKNLVGAFHFPQGVFGDLEALRTLPPPLFKEGLVEAFKHGLIRGEEALLEVEGLSPEAEGLAEYLVRAVRVKVEITEKDPLEKGERRLLNLGHTLAHALEAASRHALSHGVAVAYGLLFAALLGRALGGEDLLGPVRRLLGWLSPPAPPPLSFDELLPYLLRDKKKRREALYWVVPLGLGRLEVRPVEEGLLREVYADWQRLIVHPAPSGPPPS
ncbi:3-dehydroquinate synthase [Thermus filiformis]|uniref:3-dehydroquinate synthase n=1 Tax=Thermus filiformis TaxID=276 RepID=A0A0A2WLH1_THEFI|nr:3-dehydroquinate synthase family protein [Thermus filiformis]KGQ21036.2 3-dehydroquinate synthase [Thermus filiformis]